MISDSRLLEKTEVLRKDNIGTSPPTNARTDRNQLIKRILTHPLLPSPPALALQIVEKASDPDCEVREICALLACDPVLCGKMLKIVNSALYCPSKPVTAIDRAVAILGFNRLRSLVLGMSIPAMQFRSNSDQGLRNFWKCSVSGAIIACELSRLLSYHNPEEDLVASLLRNLGIVLLEQTFHDQYEPVWTGSTQLAAGERCRWETETFGIDHAEVGAALLRAWRLPDAIVEPIRLHHSVEQAGSLPTHLAKRANLIEFIDRLTELEDVRSTPEDLRQLLQDARERFSLEPETLEKVLVEVTPKIEAFAALVQLDIGDCPRFSIALSAGCEELVRLSMEPDDSPKSEPGADDSHTMDSAVLSPAEKSTYQGPAVRGQKPASGNSDYPPATDASIEQQFQTVGLGPGSRLQNYQIVRMIGRGAMGIVYEALDLDLGRRVAIKTLSPTRARNMDARQRFMREARTAAAVHHENVVTIFAVSEYNGVTFLVMEFVAGRSLQDWLNKGRQFTVKEIVQIGCQTARGLAAAHALRIIHRDIKPANIIVEEESERVRITDFGTARFVDSSNITQDGNIVGTPQYMSPEQVDGQPLGPTSDLFSLGSLMYTLCTGKAAFPGTTLYTVLHMVATLRPKPIRELNPAIPEWLASFVEKLHAKNPAERFPSATEAADVLESLASKARLSG
jgi:HD-like signal output (HDOD) protein/tRNA A-37 threonylcarbamoyl transferase component Bud32